jgi:cytochrome P450
MISLGTLLFLNNEKQINLFKNDSAITNSAIEELLRFLSPVQFAPRRVAMVDTKFMGQEIKKGDGIFALIPSANRDEMAFKNADKFDISRNANNHVTFGFGIHSCLGQGLARIELQIVFRRLFEKFPNLKLLEPLKNIPFKYDSQIYGLYKLLVSW